MLGDEAKVCNIPALKTDRGEVIITAKSKADLLATTFNEKYTLAVRQQNIFSQLQAQHELQWELLIPTADQAENVMSNLDGDSGTGPDLLPALILKKCAKVLSKPVAMLFLRIIATGNWPDSWKVHWVALLFKIVFFEVLALPKWKLSATIGWRRWRPGAIWECLA